MTKHEDALLENMEYCNQLAERVNKLADAIVALDKRIQFLEYRNRQNDSAYL